MNELQHEQLFTELTPAQAAAVEGGASFFNERFDFDFLRSTRTFNVRPGGSINLISSIKSGSSNSVRIRVRNVRTGNSTTAEPLKRQYDAAPNLYSNLWTNMRGGTYKIEFTDRRDGRRVAGNLRVLYT